MQTPLKTKMFIVLLLMSLTLAQGYAIHTCHSVYQSLTDRNDYINFMMNDYLKYYP